MRGPAKLFVHALDESGVEVRAPDEIEWDERLNAELVTLKASALSDGNEAERFGMVLNDRLRDAEVRFGDAFYDVVTSYLRADAITQISPDEILRETREHSPAEPLQRARCGEMIEPVLSYCVEALHDSLDYSRERAHAITVSALSHYLDERLAAIG